VSELRIQFETYFVEVCEIISKLKGFTLGEVEIVWGTFANLSTSFMTAVGQVVSAGVLTPEQGELILLQEGIITQEVVDLKPKGVADDGRGNSSIAATVVTGEEEELGLRNRNQRRASQAQGVGGNVQQG
jgi:hypothetical protein